MGVFIEGRPPWLQGVTLYSGDRTAAAEAYCDRCEEDFSTLAAPCRTCGGYRHLQGCGHCSCGPTPVRTQLCSECFVRRPLTEFSSPRTQVCDVCTCG